MPRRLYPGTLPQPLPSQPFLSDRRPCHVGSMIYAGEHHVKSTPRQETLCDRLQPGRSDPPGRHSPCNSLPLSFLMSKVCRSAQVMAMLRPPREEVGVIVTRRAPLYTCLMACASTLSPTAVGLSSLTSRILRYASFLA